MDLVRANRVYLLSFNAAEPLLPNHFSPQPKRNLNLNYLKGVAIAVEVLYLKKIQVIDNNNLRNNKGIYIFSSVQMTWFYCHFKSVSK